VHVLEPDLDVVLASQDDTREDYLTATTRFSAKVHEWLHVHILVESGTPPTAPGKVTLVVQRAGESPVTVYDHASLATSGITGVLPADMVPTLRVGSYYSDGTPSGWTFAIDDVLFSAR
jgi:hypothetical protein